MLICQQKAIKLNAEKLEYRCKEVPFHGYLLTTEGLKPDLEKVRAIVDISILSSSKGTR